MKYSTMKAKSRSCFTIGEPPVLFFQWHSVLERDEVAEATAILQREHALGDNGRASWR